MVPLLIQRPPPPGRGCVGLMGVPAAHPAALQPHAAMVGVMGGWQLLKAIPLADLLLHLRGGGGSTLGALGGSQEGALPCAALLNRPPPVLLPRCIFTSSTTAPARRSCHGIPWPAGAISLRAPQPDDGPRLLWCSSCWGDPSMVTSQLLAFWWCSWSGVRGPAGRRGLPGRGGGVETGSFEPAHTGATPVCPGRMPGHSLPEAVPRPVATSGSRSTSTNPPETSPRANSGTRG